ncbi:MAG: hypothetical protein LN545_01065 [Candidatus Megaira endosymbiont of Carteria cerasiformis]|nr:hypothetical protein [Candidatus Megaera polyxenophila]MCC8460586.1 hypothetical protein [Candidatus Megaera polyxenophila]
MRGSRTVLRETSGAVPLVYSPIKDEFTGFYRGRVIISEDFKDEVAL